MEATVTSEMASEPGLPVEIGRIDKELGKLWEASDDTKTRASLINLVVYSEKEASLSSNTEVISAIAGKHACRAILIVANPTAKESGARAWISAHCRLQKLGQRQICSEQITFRLDGASAGALPNIVFSHLDSDLPLCMWWQEDFPEPLDEKLWAWVDRLIYDSSTWMHPKHQFLLMRHLSSSGAKGTVLCDLNWTRLHAWRFGLAGMFDHAEAFPRLNRVESLRVVCAPGQNTAALLLIGWFASRLGWTPLERADAFITPLGGRVSFKIEGKAGPHVSLFSVRCEDAHFELELKEGAGFFETTIHAPGIPESHQLLPAPNPKLEETLLAELSRSGRHPLYTQAIDIVLPLINR
jgi:glucose-6-phosphate dehydrogenase assembly protein OpcA